MDGIDVLRMAWAQTWQLTLLVLGVAAVVHFVGRNRPYLAHTLWLVVLAKMVTPPLWSSPTGVFCWLNSALPQPAAASGAGLSGGTSRASAVANTWPLNADMAVKPGRRERELPIDRDAESMWDKPHAAGELRTASTLTAGAVLLGGWWIGCGLIAGVSAIRCVGAYRVILRNRIDAPESVQQLLAELSHRFKLRRPPQLWVTSHCTGPAVLGLWRPTVVLPAILIRELTPQQIEPILAHELLHVRRGDLWIGMLQVLAQSLWWFHPLVWLANRWITREAERCCDEAVLGELRCEPSRYARSLLEVLALKRTWQPLPAFPGVRPVEVTSQRLERIMKLRHGCRTRTPWWCWTVFLLAVALTVPGGALLTASAEPEIKEVKAPDHYIQINMEVMSGPLEAIAELYSTWIPLPVEIPAGQDVADQKTLPNPVATALRSTALPTTNDLRVAANPGQQIARPVVQAAHQATISTSVEKRLPALCAIVADKDMPVLRDRFRRQETNIVMQSRPTLMTADGEAAQIQIGSVRPFVVGTVKNAKGEWGPQVRVIPCGWNMHIRPVLKSAQEVQLNCQFEFSDVHDVQTYSVPVPGQSEITIQIPAVTTSRMNLCYDVPLEHTLLVRGLETVGDDGQRKSTLVMLRCRSISSELALPAPFPNAPETERIEAPRSEAKASDALPPPNQGEKILPNPESQAGNEWNEWKAVPAPSRREVGRRRGILAGDDEQVVVLDGRPADWQRFPLRTKLDLRIAAEFDEQPLKEVLLDLQEQLQIKIEFAEVQLERQGVNLNVPVSLSFPTPIKVQSVLRALLEPAGLVHVVQRDRITVVRGIGPNEVFTKAYYVADLLGMVGEHGQMLKPAVLNLNLEPQRFETSSRGHQPSMSADWASLIKMVKTTVEPASWDDAGGRAAVVPFATNMSLVISQTRTGHERIADLFEQLRRLYSVQVAVETRLIGLPETFFETLGIDVEHLNRVHGCILSKDESAAFVSAIDQDKSAKMYMAPKVTLFNGQPLSMRFDPVEKGRLLQLRPWASPNRSAVQLGFRLGEPVAKLEDLETVTLPADESLLLDAAPFLTPQSMGWVREQGIPVLDKIPYLSQLFKVNQQRPVERVFVMVTPRVLIVEEEEVEETSP